MLLPNEELFVVILVYLAPTLEVTMFESILTEIVEKAAFFEQDRVLWMGDFNVALDPVRYYYDILSCCKCWSS